MLQRSSILKLYNLDVVKKKTKSSIRPHEEEIKGKSFMDK